MRVADASFVVVDVETTGRRAASDRLIEIGAVKVCGGSVIGQFEQLINPGCAVPWRITQLTGISTAMVFERPMVADVLPQFAEFLGDGVFVAHNLSFDAGFINEERRRLGEAELRNETLCTLRLARRLLPGLRSKALPALADFYGIRIRRHHRALADAEATADILLRLLDQLAMEFDVDQVSDLLTFQHRRYSAIRRISSHIARIRDQVLDTIPDAPGVYFMKDGRGKILYVGKAQKLNTRIRSYFTSIENHAPHVRQLVKSVRQVDYEETDSELDALILESRKIKQLQPSYNRAQRRYLNRPFIRIDDAHTAPRVSSSAFLHGDGAEYYGPLADRDEAGFLVELIDRFFRLRECDDELLARGRRCVYASIDRCTAPCEDSDNAEQREELNRVRAFLSGQDDGISARIERAMKDAAAEMDYEQAATYRDWLARLRRILRKRGTVATRVLDHNAVVVHRPTEQSPRLLVISRGRHVDTLKVEDDVETSMQVLQVRLGIHFDFSSPIDVYREEEIDEIFLLSHWLYVHRSDVRQVRWDRDTPIERLVADVRAELLDRAEAAAERVESPLC